jgi:thiamine-phosphate pyrophosphorylase
LADTATAPGFRVRYLVNDRLDVAVGSGANGMHLGQGEDYAAVRSCLGTDWLFCVGVVTVVDVTAAGADDLGVSVWSIGTELEAIAGGLAGVRAVTAATRLPVVGIGGIVAGNAEQVLRAGATGVVMSSAVSRAEDPAVVVRGWRLSWGAAARFEQETEADHGRQQPGQNRWGAAE